MLMIANVLYYNHEANGDFTVNGIKQYKRTCVKKIKIKSKKTVTF